MTPVDDLNVGDTVAVINNKYHHRKCGDFSGRPWVVVAISLPFLALHDGAEVQSLDVRAWDVKKVSTQYAQAMTGTLETVVVPAVIDPYTCLQCGDRYCERMYTVKKKNQWRWWCRTCHHDGGISSRAPNQEKS